MPGNVMKQPSNIQLWIAAILLAIVAGAVAADETNEKMRANEHLKESIALAKKDKEEQNKKFKRLYIEAQEKTGFPVVQR